MASNSSSAQQRLRIIAGHLQKRVEDESASVAAQECKAEAPRSEPSSAAPVPRRRYVRVSLCAEISGSSHRLRNKHCVALKQQLRLGVKQQLAMRCISMCDLELDLNKVSIHPGGGCGGSRCLHTDGYIQIFLFTLYIEYCALSAPVQRPNQC